MTLAQKQHAFAMAVAKLLLWLEEQGYTVALGEAHRPPETAALYAKQGRGIANSLHCDRLAIDLILRRGAAVLTRSEDYAEVGNYWESLHADARWGGRFMRPDGGHFSFTHGGRA